MSAIYPMSAAGNLRKIISQRAWSSRSEVCGDRGRVCDSGRGHGEKREPFHKIGLLWCTNSWRFPAPCCLSQPYCAGKVRCGVLSLGWQHPVPAGWSGARQPRDVERLHEMSRLLCSGCGNQIDLRKEPRNVEIQRLWNAAHDLRSPRRRLSQRPPTRQRRADLRAQPVPECGPIRHDCSLTPCGPSPTICRSPLPSPVPGPVPSARAGTR